VVSWNPATRAGMSEIGTPKREAHLSPEEIVGYIDQIITEGARRQVEGHLVECEACLREVIEVRRLLRGLV